jgi:hypothetical protein
VIVLIFAVSRFVLFFSLKDEPVSFGGCLYDALILQVRGSGDIFPLLQVHPPCHMSSSAVQ